MAPAAGRARSRGPLLLPAMPWIERPQRGWIAGFITGATPSDADGVKVKVRRSGFWLFRRTKSVRTDGNGICGLGGLTPGRYRVWIDDDRPDAPVDVIVEAAQVGRAKLSIRSP